MHSLSRFGLNVVALALLGARATGWDKTSRQSAPCELAKYGHAQMPIVLSAKASPEERRVADEFAAMLKRITGATFAVEIGDGSAGIVLGTAAEFPLIAPPKPSGGRWDPDDFNDREDYVLRSSPKTLLIISADDDGVRDGVWGLLRRLGFRQYFPGPLWEFVPYEPNLSVDVDVVEHPSYALRRHFIGFGTGQPNDQNYKDWMERNRMTTRPINAPDSWMKEGDSYSAFVRRHQTEFDAHPEWTGVDTKGRRSTKLRFSSPDVRALYVADALEQLRLHPEWHSLSVSPSDGEGWINEPVESNLGSFSDRVVGLANEVAGAVRAKYPGKILELGAYDVYSTPPLQQPVGKDLIVSVATRFIRNGTDFDDLLRAWHDKTPRLAVRDYYSGWGWDHDLPGQSDASNPTAIADAIADHYSLGARVLDAESGDNWGPNGLGYYVAAQTLWNVNSVGLVRQETGEFLQHCFGTATPQMAKFYALIDGKNNPLPSDDLADRMNELLLAAKAATGDPLVRARIDCLILYARYVHLYLDFGAIRDPATRLAAIPAFKEFLFRIRGAGMVHVIEIVRVLQAAYDLPELKRFMAAPTSGEGFSPEEIDAFAHQRYATQGNAEERSFSRGLVPAPILDSLRDLPGRLNYLRGKYTLYTAGVVGQPVVLTVTGGLLSNDYGPVKIRLYPAAGGAPVDHAEVPPDKQPHEIVLHPDASGLFALTVDDAPRGHALGLANSRAHVIPRRPSVALGPPGQVQYVLLRAGGNPGGHGFSAGLGDVLDANGAKVYSFSDRPEVFHIPVPPGQDYRLWKFNNCLGPKLLLNVPPFLARSARELLVPREAVTK